MDENIQVIDTDTGAKHAAPAHSRNSNGEGAN